MLQGILAAPHGGGAETEPGGIESEIERWIVQKVREVLEEDDASIEVRKPLAAYGLDSVDAAGMLADLEDWLGSALPPSVVWEWVSARELAVRIAQQLPEAGLRARLGTPGSPEVMG